MRDGIITGNGDSRLIRANLPATYEQFRAQAAAEGLPADVLFNALGWDVLPTFLNKATLLSDPTEIALWGNAADRTVNEALLQSFYANRAAGTSSTPATTADKVATLTSGGTFVRTVGAVVTVSFSAANTAANPRLNFAGTGLAYMRWNNANLSPEMLSAGPNTLVWDGSYWQLLTPLTTQSFSGTCPTAAATAIKVVTITDTSFTLKKGVVVGVDFTYTSTVANPQLNINGKGAIYARYNGANLPAYFLQKGVNLFQFDGAYLQLLNPPAIITYNISAPNKVVEDAAGELSSVRYNLAAATDGAGNVLFGGGTVSGSASAVVERFSPDGIKITLPPLSAARYNLAAATDGAGNVLFGGGTATQSTSYSVVDKYTPAGVRTTLSGLSTSRYSLAAATDGNGNVLFGGGRTSSTSSTESAVVDKYTPAGVRTTLSALSAARDDLAAATDGAGNVLFGGGRTSSGNAVDKYTPAGVRSTLTALSAARFSLAAATDGAGNVLFGGGGSSSTVVDKYTPAGVRSTLTALSVGRSSLAAATDGAGNVLFGGGSSTAVDKYTPAGVRTTLAALLDLGGVAATDGAGNVLFGGGASTTVARRGEWIELPISIGAEYQFSEDSTPKTATKPILRLNAPNAGYIKLNNHITL